MRILLLVIVSYAMLFSLASLIKSLIVKQGKKYHFGKKRKTGTAVAIVKKQDDPKSYWLLNLFHFINIIVLAYVIFVFVTW